MTLKRKKSIEYCTIASMDRKHGINICLYYNNYLYLYHKI